MNKSQFKFMISQPILDDISNSKIIRLHITAVAPHIVYPLQVGPLGPDYKTGVEMEAAKSLLKMRMIEDIINGTWEWEKE